MLPPSQSSQAFQELALNDAITVDADYTAMIEARSLVVTLLPPGTFAAYRHEMQKRGADLAYLKPAHINVSDDIIHPLTRLCYERK